MTKSEIAALVKKADDSVKKIAKLRDSLQNEVEKLSEVYESISDASLYFETGIDQMKEGLEELSKYL